MSMRYFYMTKIIGLLLHGNHRQFPKLAKGRVGLVLTLSPVNINNSLKKNSVSSTMESLIPFFIVRITPEFELTPPYIS